MPGGKAPPTERRHPGATDCNGRPGPCGPSPAAASSPTSPTAQGAPAHRWPAYPAPCPERELKFASFREPFCQANACDLSLLLGCFAKFCWSVIPQPTPKNLENFRCGFSRSIHDKDMAKTL